MIGKPAIVVPNHMLAQFAREIAPALPAGAGVGGRHPEDLAADRRRRSWPGWPPASGTR